VFDRFIESASLRLLPKDDRQAAEGGHIKPLVAVVTKSDGPLAFGCPDAADDRLQPDAVLVRGPDLDRFVRVLGPLLSDSLLQLLWNGPPL